MPKQDSEGLNMARVLLEHSNAELHSLFRSNDFMSYAWLLKLEVGILDVQKRLTQLHGDITNHLDQMGVLSHILARSKRKMHKDIAEYVLLVANLAASTRDVAGTLAGKDYLSTAIDEQLATISAISVHAENRFWEDDARKKFTRFHDDNIDRSINITQADAEMKELKSVVCMVNYSVRLMKSASQTCRRMCLDNTKDDGYYTRKKYEVLDDLKVKHGAVKR